jgi:hypothetical protein
VFLVSGPGPGMFTGFFTFDEKTASENFVVGSHIWLFPWLSKTATAAVCRNTLRPGDSFELF